MNNLNLVKSRIALVMAIFSVIALAIPAAVVHYEYTYYEDDYAVINGFNTLFGNRLLLDYSGLLASINWLLLLASIASVVLAILVLTYFSEPTQSKVELAVVIMCFVVAHLYLVEGIATAAMWTTNDDVFTLAPIVYVLQLGMFVAYFVFKKRSNVVVEENSSVQAQNTVVAPKATITADELKKYKELLDMGAITQEEFDEQKKKWL